MNVRPPAPEEVVAGWSAFPDGSLALLTGGRGAVVVVRSALVAAARARWPGAAPVWELEGTP